MARCHGLEHPGQTRIKQQSTRAPWIGASGGPQRKEDKHQEHGLEHPRKNKEAGNRALWSGTSGGQWTTTLDRIIRERSEWPQIGASGAVQGEGGGKNKRPRQKRSRARNGTKTEGEARREGDE